MSSPSQGMGGLPSPNQGSTPTARPRASSGFPSIPSFSSLSSYFSSAAPTPKAITPEEREFLRDVDKIAEGANFYPNHADELIEKLKVALRPVSPDRRAEIILEAKSPCVRSYLKDVFTNLDRQMASSAAASEGMRPEDKQSFEEDANRIKDTYYAGIIELIVSGYRVVLRDNLEFNPQGVPIGMRPADRSRFPLCHAHLRTQAGLPVEAVEGQGRTRRRRRKGNKTKARKMKRKKSSRR